MAGRAGEVYEKWNKNMYQSHCVHTASKIRGWRRCNTSKLSLAQEISIEHDLWINEISNQIFYNIM